MRLLLSPILDGTEDSRVSRRDIENRPSIAITRETCKLMCHCARVCWAPTTRLLADGLTKDDGDPVGPFVAVRSGPSLTSHLGDGCASQLKTNKNTTVMETAPWAGILKQLLTSLAVNGFGDP